jgi:hypothetical protein
MDSRRTLTTLAVAAAVTLGAAPAARAHHPPKAPTVQELTSFAAPGCAGGCGSGSTVGPDGALYVTDGKAGRVLRVNPRTGATTTFATGLPESAIDIGGAMDVAFSGHTAYVLVTTVGPFFGQEGVVDGIYRIGRHGNATPIADIGAWSIDNPPPTPFFVASGVQYSMQAFRGGFLVTDGHHNRVLWVSRRGDIVPLIQFDNSVPTGLETWGRRVFVGKAGPVPHLPENGRVLTFVPGEPQATEVARGAPLITDVEFGPHGLYALSQGIWTLDPTNPDNEGMPASANTGTIVRVRPRGRFEPVAGPLDRPTSLEFIGDTAYVVTLTGTVLRIR